MIDKNIDEGEIVVDIVGDLVFESKDDRTEHTVPQSVQLVGLHAERFSHLFDAGHSTQLAGETLLGCLELAGECADRAGGPVGGTNRIEDRSSNTLCGKAVERHSSGSHRSVVLLRPIPELRLGPVLRAPRDVESARQLAARCA